MSRLVMNVHPSDSYYPTRVFFSFNSEDKAHAESESAVILIQRGDARFVEELRSIANDLEATINKDSRKAAIAARIQAELEAEGAA